MHSMFLNKAKTQHFCWVVITSLRSSAAVIHIILHRMRCHAVAVLFFLFQFEVAFDLINRELDLPRNGSASGSCLGGFSFECNG
jgi:hypothetical protein